MPHELIGLFELAGFRDVQLFGSTAGERFDRMSQRLIAVGQRPE
jgi:hypothetical protein